MLIRLAKAIWNALRPEAAMAAAPPVRTAAQRRTAVVAPGERRNSPAMARTLVLLAANPSLTASEVAQKAKVSPSYARTLLRRARAHATEAGTAQGTEITTMLQDLQQRLTSTEEDLAAVRAMPVHARASLNLNRRAEVLRLLEGGLAPQSVAERLGIPEGEVDFIRKVDGMLASSV